MLLSLFVAVIVKTGFIFGHGERLVEVEALNNAA